LKIGFLRIFFCRFYRSQTDYNKDLYSIVGTVITYHFPLVNVLFIRLHPMAIVFTMQDP